jgi:hypothetical protein
VRPRARAARETLATMYVVDGYIALVFVGLFSFNRILEYEIVKKKIFHIRIVSKRYKKIMFTIENDISRLVT